MIRLQSIEFLFFHNSFGKKCELLSEWMMSHLLEIYMENHTIAIRSVSISHYYIFFQYANLFFFFTLHNKAKCQISCLNWVSLSIHMQWNCTYHVFVDYPAKPSVFKRQAAKLIKKSYFHYLNNKFQSFPLYRATYILNYLHGELPMRKQTMILKNICPPLTCSWKTLLPPAVVNWPSRTWCACQTRKKKNTYSKVYCIHNFMLYFTHTLKN